MISSIIHSFVLLGVLRAIPTQAANVTIPASTPTNAQDLPSTHISFSIEQDRWPDWAGTLGSRNEFTHNALSNLASLTGTPPKIRVGANSEDHTTWSPTVTILEESFPPFSSITPYPEANSITVGDGFYQLSKWLPSGTIMTWGVNFGLDNATNAINMAKSILKAFGTPEVKSANVKLDLIEVGNEADLYKNNGLRPSTWTQAQYIADWENITGAVVSATNLASTGVGIQGASFAGQGFTITGIINGGILASTPGKLIRQFSQHRYSAAFCSGGSFALSSFMNKNSVRTNLTVFSSDVATVKAQGMPYVLGETNSIACHGAPGVSNTAGAALWVLDYTLQAAVQGMTETFFHEGVGYKYNFFQPVTLNRSITDGTTLSSPQAPHVMPAYYAAILGNRAIGTSGTAKIVELTVSDSNVSGYAIYEGGKLVRAVFVNLDAWLTSSTGTRPSANLTFSFGTGGPTKATGRRLVISHADDTSGLTLGGQSYETSNAIVSGTEQLESITLANGVNLRSTEAILLTF